MTRLANDRFLIHRATSADEPAIVSCLQEAFEPYRTAYTRDAFIDTTLDADRVRQRVREMHVLVAVCEGQIVGTVAGTSDLGDGHIRGMAVRAVALGSGIAGNLLETIENELRARGCTRVTLDTTEPLERAMRFYEKHGYRRTGRRSNFFGMSLIEYAKNL